MEELTPEECRRFVNALENYSDPPELSEKTKAALIELAYMGVLEPVDAEGRPFRARRGDHIEVVRGS